MILIHRHKFITRRRAKLVKRFNTNNNNNIKTGILLLNLGGPSTLDHVEPFLTRLLSDREIIKIPFQKQLGKYMAKRRALKVKEQYRKIGGGSPIFRWTDLQGKLLTKALNEESPETGPHKHYIAFRYADPLTEHALEEIKKDGVSRVVVFSQYPQYSCSTTGSSINELYRKIVESGISGIQWGIIDRWPTYPLLIKAFVSLIKESIEENFTPEERNDVFLIFSAHSLPMKVVNRGDHYPYEVGATVEAIMKELGQYQYVIAWQSKVGPASWLKPTTQDTILQLAKKGRKNQLLVPVAFTSDHIETLYEYDIMYSELAKKNDINLKRVKSLNDHPLFIQALVSRVKDHFKNPQLHHQFEETCVGCDNEYCKKAKDHF